jgi:hypothetical protein
MEEHLIVKIEDRMGKTEGVGRMMREEDENQKNGLKRAHIGFLGAGDVIAAASISRAEGRAAQRSVLTSRRPHLAARRATGL